MIYTAESTSITMSLHLYMYCWAFVNAVMNFRVS